jgi:KDO2-lipid IV(A) lauroyltransferase
MQLLVYILVYPIIWIISIIPTRLLYVISDLLFVLVYYIVGYRKKTVQTNLILCFPEKSKEEINIIRKKFYHHFCDMILESVKSVSISEAELKRRFIPTNIEEIRAIEEMNRSMVMVLGHYASWEWIFILQRHTSFKGYAIYKRLENKYFDALVKRVRAKYNTFLITTKEAIPVLVESKAKGELTLNGFVGDQSPKENKGYHWNKFMGIMVPFHTGAELMAKRLDMPVVFCKVSKVKRGYYEATFKTITLNPNEYDNYDITDNYMKLLEEQIYEAPEYYLWTHKRWKHRDKVPEKYL